MQIKIIINLNSTIVLGVKLAIIFIIKLLALGKARALLYLYLFRSLFAYVHVVVVTQFTLENYIQFSGFLVFGFIAPKPYNTIGKFIIKLETI